MQQFNSILLDYFTRIRLVKNQPLSRHRTTTLQTTIGSLTTYPGQSRRNQQLSTLLHHSSQLSSTFAAEDGAYAMLRP